MKKYKYIVLITVLMLLTNGSCKDQEGQRFIIQNNSDEEIILQFGIYGPISQVNSCMKPTTAMEKEEMIYSKVVFPNSAKNFERNRLGEELIDNPNDTLYIGVFNRADVDTMSCEEFEQKFPLKKEWKVTLADMQARNWVLVYTPETQGIE